MGKGGHACGRGDRRRGLEIGARIIMAFVTKAMLPPINKQAAKTSRISSKPLIA
jgi:hypothetical protein